MTIPSMINASYGPDTLCDKLVQARACHNYVNYERYGPELSDHITINVLLLPLLYRQDSQIAEYIDTRNEADRCRVRNVVLQSHRLQAAKKT